MTVTTDKLTPDLSPWSDYADSLEWESLLVGNGASRAIWENFSYPSLFDVARDLPAGDRLTSEDIELFGRLGDTKNFESVLGSLLTSRAVATALDLQPRERIAQRYASIQKALVAAVHRVHVPWAVVPSETLLAIRNSLLTYETVFSTNYDLLLYWAIMADHPGLFRDYFWSTVFDSSNTKVWGTATRILYLHGALHLYYGTDGQTYKERAETDVNLLDLFGRRADAVPLCVTEGTAQEKLSVIARSDYLSFAFQQLGSATGPMVLLARP